MAFKLKEKSPIESLHSMGLGTSLFHRLIMGLLHRTID